jgi:hypothetical protein
MKFILHLDDERPDALSAIGSALRYLDEGREGGIVAYAYGARRPSFRVRSTKTGTVCVWQQDPTRDMSFCRDDDGDVMCCCCDCWKAARAACG